MEASLEIYFLTWKLAQFPSMEVGGIEVDFLPLKYVECSMEVHGNVYRSILKNERVCKALSPWQMRVQNESTHGCSPSVTQSVPSVVAATSHLRSGRPLGIRVALEAILRHAFHPGRNGKLTG